MKEMHVARRLMLCGSVAAIAFAVAGLSASAQTDTTSATTSSTSTSSSSAGDLTTRGRAPKGTATPEMVQEACQRQKARTAKFVQFGIPEQWGSEEPFTFDPNTPCS
jgi:hypothetical protein